MVILLPLGFGSKLFRWPILTLCIGIFTIAFYFLDPFISQIPYRNTYLTAKEKAGLFSAAPAALTAYCKEKVGEHLCPLAAEFMAKEIEMEIKEVKSSQGYKERFIDFCKKNKISPDEAEKFYSVSYKIGVNYEEAIKKYAPEESQAFVEELRIAHKAEKLYSPLNENLTSLFLAQIRHADIMHLVGNMFFLILIGTLLEQRMSRIKLFVLYLCSGVFGLYAHIKLEAGDIGTLLGSSASVSGFFGAALVFYFKHRMAFVAWFVPIFQRREFFIQFGPIMALLYLSADISGAIESRSSTAHLAHLGGWLTGIFIALEDKFKNPLSYPHISPDETQTEDEIYHTSTPTLRITKSRELLKRNRENLYAKQILLIDLLKQNETAVTTPEIHRYFSETVAVLIRTESDTELIHFLKNLNFLSKWDALASSLSKDTKRKILELLRTRRETLLYFKMLSAFEATQKHLKFIEAYFHANSTASFFSPPIELKHLLSTGSLAPRTENLAQVYLENSERVKHVRTA